MHDAPAAETAAPAVPVAPAVLAAPAAPHPWRWLPAALALVALAFSGLLWQKLSAIEQQLARQSAETGAQALEARALARQALDLAQQAGARQAVLEARLSEVALQRSQLEDLMQSLSRSRDETLAVDLESSVRLAQQQAQLTGSVEPLLAALKTADQRIARAAQPRLAPVQRALRADIERVKSASVTDTPGLLARLDELVREVDDLPVVNQVLPAPARAGADVPELGAGTWWRRVLEVLSSEARQLLRVSRIEQPEAMLLSPGQAFFLRENLKLKLLNARMGLLARQTDPARADLAAAAAALDKYFDPGSRKTQAAAALLRQTLAQTRAIELPRLDDTLAALAAASR